MTRQKPLQAAIAAAMISAMTATAVAHAEDEGQKSVSQAIDYRTSVMTVIRWNFKPMGDMLKGKRPYDGAAFTRHMRDLENAVSLDLLAGFPEDSDEGEDTSAKAEIWMNWEDFEQKFKDLRQQTARLSKAVQGGDRSDIEAEFNALGKACKACHREYKE